MSEFARTSSADSPAPAAYPAAVDPQTGATARPAVLVDEMTVPASAQQRPAGSPVAMPPMALAPPAASPTSLTQPETGIAPSATNLNRVPEQPKTKLLSPEEKARVIAELEALAKKQSATLGNSKDSTTCADDNLPPAQRVASATGDAGC